MEQINIVILAEETQYRVKAKHKIIGDNIAIVGYADFQEESKLKIEGYFPDVVIAAIDSSNIDENFYSFIQSVQFQNTGCSVILLTDKVDVNLINNAAMLGIRQVFDFDIDEQTFSKAIVNVNDLERQRMSLLNIEKRVRAKVIGFWGVKGGVGTTTLVANTAISLANRGKKVIVMDYDLQYGDLNLQLNVDPKDTIVELARDSEGTSIERINSTVVMHPSGFSVLCAPKAPEYAEYVTSEHAKKIIENVRPYFEYILIDLGTNYADTTLVAMENCDEVQLVANLDISCLKGLKSAMNILETLRIADKAQLVINKNRAGLLKVKDFENLIQKKAYATIISDSKVCNNALNSGLPCVFGAPRSQSAKDFSKYCEKLIEEKNKI